MSKKEHIVLVTNVKNKDIMEANSALYANLNPNVTVSVYYTKLGSKVKHEFDGAHIIYAASRYTDYDLATIGGIRSCNKVCKSFTFIGMKSIESKTYMADDTTSFINNDNSNLDYIVALLKPYYESYIRIHSIPKLSLSSKVGMLGNFKLLRRVIKGTNKEIE